MPGWHKKTKELVAAGKLVLVGVTQEQHAERCRLFAQWQGFEWPILHDPINVLESSAVPIVTAIDEFGVVRSTRPTADWLKTEFLSAKYSAATGSNKATKPSISALEKTAKAEQTSSAYRSLGDAYSLWQAKEPTLAVDAYNKALQLDEKSAVNHFRLGVALRSRHDSKFRQQSDFARAVGHWTSALEMNPGQYIWRRRIQQYGPRLDKPYPFYDWVEQAGKEIQSRGEKPIPLTVSLTGAEIAGPSRTFETTRGKSPDPSNGITQDLGEYVEMNIAASPAAVKPGESIRLHLEFSLKSKDVLWNNEAEPLRVWFGEPDGWTPAQSLVTHVGKPKAVETSEVRRIEVEMKSSTDARSQSIKAFALYYICDQKSGECMLRRQDFSFQANIH